MKIGWEMIVRRPENKSRDLLGIRTARMYSHKLLRICSTRANGANIMNNMICVAAGTQFLLHYMRNLVPLCLCQTLILIESLSLSLWFTRVDCAEVEVGQRGCSSMKQIQWDWFCVDLFCLIHIIILFG